MGGVVTGDGVRLALIPTPIKIIMGRPGHIRQVECRALGATYGVQPIKKRNTTIKYNWAMISSIGFSEGASKILKRG